MIPADMPAEFAEVICQHGGEWLEWSRCTDWAAVTGNTSFVIGGAGWGRVSVYRGTSSPGLPLVGLAEVNPVSIVPGEHSQTLENWFYQARMAAEGWTSAAMHVSPDRKTVTFIREVEVVHTPDRPDEFVSGTFEAQP